MKLQKSCFALGGLLLLSSCQSPAATEAEASNELRAEVKALRAELEVVRLELAEQNAGQTEALLVEHLAELQGELVGLKLQMRDHHPRVVAMHGEISALEELLAQRKEEQ